MSLVTAEIHCTICRRLSGATEDCCPGPAAPNALYDYDCSKLCHDIQTANIHHLNDKQRSTLLSLAGECLVRKNAMLQQPGTRFSKDHKIYHTLIIRLS